MIPKNPLQGAHDSNIVFMEDVEHLAFLFAAIVVLTESSDKVVHGLARVGSHIATMLGNDIDLLTEGLEDDGARH